MQRPIRSIVILTAKHTTIFVFLSIRCFVCGVLNQSFLKTLLHNLSKGCILDGSQKQFYFVTQTKVLDLRFGRIISRQELLELNYFVRKCFLGGRYGKRIKKMRS